MPPWLSIDPRSEVAPFDQLRIGIIEAVTRGDLVPGSRLPTVRGLAQDLGIAPNTVARSYRELERDEVIETRGRNGTFVAATGDARERHAQAAATAFAERIVQLRYPPERAIELVRTALTALPDIR
ncbi:MAG: GntR family transcriptional regulator [Burkholderiaceae bacterium]|nr:GntR family transcriptional regulator [Microbacteriaceae bacterium]